MLKHHQVTQRSDAGYECRQPVTQGGFVPMEGLDPISGKPEQCRMQLGMRLGPRLDDMMKWRGPPQRVSRVQ